MVKENVGFDNFLKVVVSSFFALFIVIIGIGFFYNSFIEFWNLVGAGKISGYNNWLIGEISLVALVLSIVSSVAIPIFFIVNKERLGYFAVSLMFLFYALYRALFAYASNELILSNKSFVISIFFFILFIFTLFLYLNPGETIKKALFLITSLFVILAAWLPPYLAIIYNGGDPYYNFWQSVVDAIKVSSQEFPLIILGGAFSIAVAATIFIASILSMRVEEPIESGATMFFTGLALVVWIVGLVVSLMRYSLIFIQAIDIIGLDAGFSFFFFSIFIALSLMIFIGSSFYLFGSFATIEVAKEAPGIVVKEKVKKKKKPEEELGEEELEVEIEDFDVEL